MVLVNDLHTLKNLERANLVTLHEATGKMRSGIVGGARVRCWFVKSYTLRNFVFKKHEYSMRFHQGCVFPFVYRMTEPKNVI